MNKLVATTAIALAILTGAASAMTQSTADEQAIRQYAPNADVSSLTTAEVNSLLTVIHSGDTESEKRGIIMSLLK